MDSVTIKKDPLKAARQLRRLQTATSVYDRANTDRVFAQVEKGVRNRAMSKLMWANLRREGFNLESSLRAYTGPAPVVFGWQDPIGATTVYQLIKALPQAEVRGINEAGHFVNVEQSAAFYGVVNSFLNRHLPPSKSW